LRPKFGKHFPTLRKSERAIDAIEWYFAEGEEFCDEREGFLPGGESDTNRLLVLKNE
jgi:hypothetical protein